ncbi:hypothetical protein JW935_13615 [candidate division KSB1 bacterium]|nr:hypothetical protein [candidate division KSB1 bacterium]
MKFTFFYCLLITLVFPACSKKSTEPAEAESMKERRLRVLSYLEALPNGDENRVLSGQQAGGAGYLDTGFQNLIQKLYDKTGKWCALLGVDYGGVSAANYKDANAVIIEHWKNNEKCQKCNFERQNSKTM